MAKITICQIDGCEKVAKQRGMCPMHYTRLRMHGDVSYQAVRRGDARKFLEQTAIPYQGDECLFWPFTKTKGYGWIKDNGKGAYVHRLVCEAVNGPAPTEDSVARHSCANGHLGCVTPRHLSWGTHQDNSDDCLLHGNRARGERHGESKLTEKSVIEIRSLKGSEPAKTLASRFGVQVNSIYRIWKGLRWKHLIT